jgi:hypothetical protein
MATRRILSRGHLGLLLSAVILVLTVGAAGAASPTARIVSAKGTVQVLAAPSGQWVAAASPAPVPPGSAVRTGSKSKAVLELDGAEVTLYETSLIRIPAEAVPASAATNPLRHPWLDSGRALFDVTPRKDHAPFSVQTPTVVAGVKGTVFEVSSTGTEESVYVWDGLVEVTSLVNTGDIQLVAAGEFTMLDDLRLTPALPIPGERIRPDEVDLNRHAMEAAAAAERPASAERVTEDFPVSTPLDSKLAVTTEVWREADRAAVTPALDQALDFQSVVSIGTVRVSADSLTNSLTTTATTATTSTRALTDAVASTASTIVDPASSAVSSTVTTLVSPVTQVVAPVTSPLTPVVDPLTSILAPVVPPLESTVSTVVVPLRTLGF